MLFFVAAAVVECQPNIDFEVASIKPTVVLPGQPIHRGEMGIFVTPTSAYFRNLTLISLISWAFQVSQVQVVGPAKLENTFTIMAKIPPGTRRDRIPEMLQNLLRKRFGMECHEEKRLVKGGELSIEDAEMLHKQLLTGDAPRMPPRGLGRPARLISSLLEIGARLSELMGVPVLGDTMPSNEDRYLFWLETTDGAASIASSLKRYGIHLTFGRIAARYVVIDRISMTPTEE